jgi:DNA-binding helix-hairpin-helix protein with protein kinase domain
MHTVQDFFRKVQRNPSAGLRSSKWPISRESRNAALLVDHDYKVVQGGEGAVYRIPGDPSSVAKIYFDAGDARARSHKLRKMLADPPRDPMAPDAVSIAWPTDLVVDGAGHVRDSSCRSPAA